MGMIGVEIELGQDDFQRVAPKVNKCKGAIEFGNVISLAEAGTDTINDVVFG